MNIVNGLYGSEFMECKACGFCKYHKCYLTVRQLKQHGCLQKQCKHLQKNEEHQYWHQREAKKQKRKKRKEDINNYVNSVKGNI